MPTTGDIRPKFKIGATVLVDHEGLSGTIISVRWRPRPAGFIYHIPGNYIGTEFSEAWLLTYNPPPTREDTSMMNDTPQKGTTETEAPQPSAAELMARAADMESTAKNLRQRAAEQLAAIEVARRPTMPALGGTGDRAIVSFTRYQSGRAYNYAAVGWVAFTRGESKAVRWAITGEETRRMNWAGLLEFIGEANWPSLYEMTESQLLGPDIGHEGPVAETMGPYGRVVGSGPVSDADPLRRYMGLT